MNWERGIEGGLISEQKRLGGIKIETKIHIQLMAGNVCSRIL